MKPSVIVFSTFLQIVTARRSVSGYWSATTSTRTGFLDYLALSQRVKKVLFQGVNLEFFPWLICWKLVWNASLKVENTNPESLS